jgi:hypothetical protein
MEKSLVDIQTDLFLQKRYVRIFNTHTTDEIIKKVLEYSKHHSTFLLLIYFEIIFDSRDFQKISECLNSIPNKVWIMSTTATKHPLYVEPIVNLLVWKEQLIDELDETTYVPAFPNDLWENRKYNIENKEIISILSLRRQNKQRDLLYERVNDTQVSIKRYYHQEPEKDYPLWKDLVNEYLKTYISFVCETTYPSWTETTCVTEKSILSFLCGNIPIILGKKRLVKELKEMGFWIANEYFGYDEYADSLDDFSEEKINLFVKCIENVNKIDIKKFYMDNINKINNNHKIIQDSFQKKYVI